MKQALVALFSGFIFGIGLALSKMIEPNKVLNFLDVTGDWDPSLALVMGGALSVTFITFRLILTKDHPLFESTFKLPTRTEIDKPLIIGAILFGIGWGIAGFCPAPALSNLAINLKDAAIFVLAMMLGFWVQGYRYKR
jgi:uncharacterized membrane protein YedE/YeeE